ncbi:hypothetical protein [Oxalicibacterium flavum]|uniref:hypothetical protein n=1 Tax=Oxalicibacterium flavum TaxID=179467 RepID=UPI00166C545B|nr:hypothetical protein [Oxalicibacterium flavum]
MAVPLEVGEWRPQARKKDAQNWNTFLCTSTTTIQQGLCHVSKAREPRLKGMNGKEDRWFTDCGIRMVRLAPRQCTTHAAMKKAAGLLALRLIFPCKRC